MRILRSIKTNWARTCSCKVSQVRCPKDEEEIIALVKEANKEGKKLKVVGGGDSYNDIFCPEEGGILLSLKAMDRVLEVDKRLNRVTFEAGIMMPDLIRYLKKEGLSLSNLGTNIFDNLAGACSTGYHGSGINYAIFSSFVTAFEIITPTGEKRRIEKGDDAFAIYAVGLGVLGIITKITLQCEPYFKLEVIEKKMPFEQIEAEFEQLLAKNDHFKFIWVPHTRDFMVWLGNRTDKPRSSGFKKFMTYFTTGLLINNLFHEFLLFFASFRRSLVPRINRLMSRILLPKYSESVYDAHWAFFLPHLLKQDVVEYAFDIKDTFKVFKEVIAMIEEKGIYVDTPVEVRFVNGDNYWMSPSYGMDSCWIGTKIHFPYYRHPEYQRYFTEIDTILLRYRGRPHWGKQFRITTEDFKRAYPKWDAFWNYVDQEDPNRILQNGFIRRLRGLEA
jgi:L-gulonolactone oxidase